MMAEVEGEVGKKINFTQEGGDNTTFSLWCFLVLSSLNIVPFPKKKY